ncbi:MAG: hypothetical protein WCP97_07425 [bacterium]
MRRLNYQATRLAQRDGAPPTENLQPIWDSLMAFKDAMVVTAHVLVERFQTNLPGVVNDPKTIAWIAGAGIVFIAGKIGVDAVRDRLIDTEKNQLSRKHVNLRVLAPEAGPDQATICGTVPIDVGARHLVIHDLPAKDRRKLAYKHARTIGKIIAGYMIDHDINPRTARINVEQPCVDGRNPLMDGYGLPKPLPGKNSEVKTDDDHVGNVALAEQGNWVSRLVNGVSLEKNPHLNCGARGKFDFIFSRLKKWADEDIQNRDKVYHMLERAAVVVSLRINFIYLYHNLIQVHAIRAGINEELRNRGYAGGARTRWFTAVKSNPDKEEPFINKDGTRKVATV